MIPISPPQRVIAVPLILAALTGAAWTTTHQRTAASDEQLRLAYHTSPLAAPDCEVHRSPDRVSGTGPDSAGDGPDAILAFQHAYYTLRSAATARESIAPEAHVPSTADIQAGIDSLPPDTRYCVHITPRLASIGSVQYWNVELRQQYPGEPQTTLHQAVTTRAASGRTVITAVSAV